MTARTNKGKSYGEGRADLVRPTHRDEAAMDGAPELWWEVRSCGFLRYGGKCAAFGRNDNLVPTGSSVYWLLALQCGV